MQRIWVAALAIGSLGWAMSAEAGTITTTTYLDNLYTGTQPNPSSYPNNANIWLGATLARTSSSGKTYDRYTYQYTLTLTSYLTGTEKVQGSSSGSKPPIGWAFNFTTTQSGSQVGTMAGFGRYVPSGSPFTATGASGIVYNTLTMLSPVANNLTNSSIGTGSVPVRDGYDLAFYWQKGFGGTESVSYRFNSNDLWSITDQARGFASVAHIQGINPSNCSGWITDTNSQTPNAPSAGYGSCNPVPEPSEWTLMLPGLFLIGGLAFWSRKRSKGKQGISLAA
ncbi:hypothetical protein [Acidihalobacter aeolianus]|uniref:hypothetical protein n=1 Tax=Acidihalobacter aeolianus TaxID=2792603 RepID=UPI0012EA1563|nr:hypothetical protein [Acidihalobacter aeolianus]